jgi:hypothetical protein
MTDDYSALPLPPAVLARLRTADSLRAEVAGLTAERDALRAELDTAGWERDTAQGEAAALREDVLHRDGYYGGQPRTIGLILTTGDVPPAPPEDEHGEDIALVSLTTGELYLRASHAPDQWTRYGVSHSFSDFATLGEKGPWITVGTFAVRDHKQVVERDRRLRDAIYAISARWPSVPESAQHAVDTVVEFKQRSVFKQPETSEWINALSTLASAMWSAWLHEHEALVALRATDDEPAEAIS